MAAEPPALYLCRMRTCPNTQVFVFSRILSYLKVRANNLKEKMRGKTKKKNVEKMKNITLEEPGDRQKMSN